MKQRNDVQVAAVYRTEELDSFNNMKGNRIPNLCHVRRLVASINTNGMKMNPIIVNEFFEVIDGQHRLLAAKETNSCIYYMIVPGANLSDVQILNLNQRNWTKKDYMDGYADIGILPYVKLKEFCEKNKDFNINDCISLCSNITSSSGLTNAQKNRADGTRNLSEVFEDGTWKGKDFLLAQEYANKIRLIGQYYPGYSRSVFVGTMIGLMKYYAFDYDHFMHKLSIQPTSLVDCAKRDQYRDLIEDIYNYKSREKVSFKYI